MGYLQDWFFSIKKHSSLVFFFFFLILISTHSRFVPPAGREISKLNKADPQTSVRGEKWVMEKRVIGSRPPRCESKCRGCGQCVAVQVPIAPPLLLKIRTTKKSVYSTTTKFIAYSRGDDFSNYKPMCWVCKCGDFIFSP